MFYNKFHSTIGISICAALLSTIALEHTYKVAVRIRATSTISEVLVYSYTTIEEMISSICAKEGLDSSEHYYIVMNGQRVESHQTIQSTNLHTLTLTNITELCTKISYLLQTASHIGQHISLTSTEEVRAEDILNISPSVNITNLFPDHIRQTCANIASHKLALDNGTKTEYVEVSKHSVLVSMPIFNHSIINDLPSISLTIPVKQNEFNWQSLLQHLADDLEVDKNDLIILDASEGSTNIKVTFKKSILTAKERLRKIAAKFTIIIKDKSSKVINYLKTLPVTTAKSFEIIPNIHGEIKNFEKISNGEILLPEDIDIFLELNERPAVIEPDTWKFLQEKSRQLSTIILRSFQDSEVEYVISSMVMVSNEQLTLEYKQYSSMLRNQNERILFHGTRDIRNVNGIFEDNFRFSGITGGWYGSGMYFASSPKYAAFYANLANRNPVTTYLLCNIVSLGNSLHVTDMSFFNKPLHPSYNSHYITILPLYIVGLRLENKFVLWRNSQITDARNVELLERLKYTYHFNIYAIRTSDDALKLFKRKATSGNIKCVIITNGAEGGQQFADECRKICVNVPIIVYCGQVALHQPWATALGGDPPILVTMKYQDVFDYIDEKLVKICLAIPNIPLNARWTENGVTVAGSRERGDGLHQLSYLYEDLPKTEETYGSMLLLSFKGVEGEAVVVPEWLCFGRDADLEGVGVGEGVGEAGREEYTPTPTPAPTHTHTHTLTHTLKMLFSNEIFG
ncbi:hypothetical protein I4U23_005591 [Adineta vaga]|nr:hypothetical protein I4U23_005591 [Adineta vaga]